LPRDSKPLVVEAQLLRIACDLVEGDEALCQSRDLRAYRTCRIEHVHACAAQARRTMSHRLNRRGLGLTRPVTVSNRWVHRRRLSRLPCGRSLHGLFDGARSNGHGTDIERGRSVIIAGARRAQHDLVPVPQGLLTPDPFAIDIRAVEAPKIAKDK